jgi:HKD family nuclease
MASNLVDQLFDKKKDFQMGIFCTYSLNLDFLESYLLKLNGVASCSDLCIFTDRSIYNSHFNINATTRPKWINKRYLVTPVDTKGVFHPKLYLLASDKAVRIGIGSANLTREGLANNLEIVTVVEVTNKDKKYANFLSECLHFLVAVASASKSSSAIECVNKFIHYTSHLLGDGGDSPIHLIHNLEKPIIDQVVQKLDREVVKRIRVISPFYDHHLKVHRFLKSKYPDAAIKLFIQQGKSNFPIDTYQYEKETAEIFVYHDFDRYIHGKAVIFETEKGTYLLTGSPNYTESAMLKSGFTANIEAAIFGEIDAEASKEMCTPNGKLATPLQSISQLITAPNEEEAASDDGTIPNWLIEVKNLDTYLDIMLNEATKLTPQYLLLNGDGKNRIAYQSKISKNEIGTSELIYAHIEGVDEKHQPVKSGKVWIVNLDTDRDDSIKKTYQISDPSQITTILVDLIKNGSEQELIEYLLRFDIPLDLAAFHFRGKGLRAVDSKGNIFGELLQQNKSILKNVGVFEAVQQFLTKNVKKLNAHYENVQLNKLDNFMLIYGTIFNTLQVFHDLIKKMHRKNPINYDDWATMRNYYDLMLKSIKDVLDLVWGTEEYAGFEAIVNDAIQNDEQNLLGNIESFKDFIIKSDYGNQYKLSLVTSRAIIKRLESYIEKGKIKTVLGFTVKAPLSDNDIQDRYIHKRKEILEMVDNLLSDLEMWNKE